MTDYLYFILGVLILFLFRRTLIADEIEQIALFRTEAEKYPETDLLLDHVEHSPAPPAEQQPVLLTHHSVYLPAKIDEASPLL